MHEYRYVILGGGMVAGYAVKELVKRGVKRDEVLIVSEDDALPYERPPLSKDFLAGRTSAADALINPGSFYREHGIDLRLETMVESLDIDRRVLHTDVGPAVKYEKLLIATGARPRRLDLPGGDLAGLYYLRSLNDASVLRNEIGLARQAAVIGGGFIGMEVAAVLAGRGVRTTLIHSESRLNPRVFTSEMAAFFEKYYRRREVRLVPEQRAVSFEPDDAGERVSEVVLDNQEMVDIDLVVAGIGVEPCVEVAADAGLAVDDGIVVNEYLEAAEGVWAAGDVAKYQDVLFNKQRRVEHWDNAVSQGAHAARQMVGDREPFVHVPYFFSDVFDLSWEYWGDHADADRVVYRGAIDKGEFSVWWMAGGKLVAAFVMSRPEEESDLAPEWVRSGVRISPDRLADTNRKLTPADADAAG